MFARGSVLAGRGIRVSILFFAIAILGLFTLSGCGGGSKPASVSVTASVSTVDGADTVTLTATVTNDKGTDGVSWSVSGGGTLSNTTTTSATYTAPAATSSAQTVTVTATSVADTTKSASVTLTIAAKPAITPPSGTQLTGAVGAAYSLQLTETGGVGPYTWTLTAGTLPTGWTLTPGGLLSGPAPVAGQAGTINLTFTVTDSGTPTALTATLPLTVTIVAAPAITFTGIMPATATYASPAPYVGFATATGGAGTLTYSIVGGSLPPGLELMSTGSGQVGGTPTAVGTFNFTMKAADPYGDSATQAYTIVVSYPALKVTAATLPTGYAGSTYAQTTLAATGGSGAGYSFALASGSSLPAGLNLSAAGAITGKPTAQGTTNFTVTVTDSASNTANGTFSITVNPAVSITTASPLATGYVGSNYSQTLAATGGSGTGYSWAVANGSTLPGGLSLSAAGVLSGKPTATGNPSFSVTVTDSASNTATAAFSLSIQAGVSITTPAALPTGFVAASYSQTFAAVGGSGTGYTWAVASGSSLPAGLSLSSGGVLSGNPTASGTSTFTLTVTDSAANTTGLAFSLIINSALTITSPTTLPTAYVGTLYAQTLTAAGGSGTGYVWALANGQSLPQGLTLTTAGILSGTPQSPNATSVQVTVTDSAQNTASKILGININAALVIDSQTALPTGYAGSNYAQTLSVTGGSGTGYAWAVSAGSNLPSGLTLSAAGVLSGIPAATGNFSFSITATDSAQNTSSATFTLGIQAGVSITTPTTLPAGYQGAVYANTTLSATGGTGTGFAWALASGSSLPTGLSLSGAGVISGTPSVSGTFTFTVTATDSLQNAASATFSLTVVQSLSITTGGTLPSAAVNAAYSNTLVATGGSGTKTWSTDGAGATSLASYQLALSSAGVVSGTPTSAGTASFTATVTDSAGHTKSQLFTIAITNQLTITTASLPPAYTGVAYSQALMAVGGSGNSLNYNWSWSATSGTLPAGLSLGTTGIISGAPSTAGTYNITISLQDAPTSEIVTKNLTLTVYNALTVTTASPLPVAYTNANYNQQLNASGGSGTGYTWTIISGAPSFSGVGYSLTGNVISGTPSHPAYVGFTVQVTDSLGNTATKQLDLWSYDPITLSSTNLTAIGYVTKKYSGSITASGGSGTGYVWTVTGLNSPFSYSYNVNNTLAISGNPLAVGTVQFAVTVTDSVGSSVGPINFSFTIYKYPTLPDPNPTSLGTATVNQSYTGFINLSDGVSPYQWTVNNNLVSTDGVTATALSNGLSVTSTGGSTLTVSGTPTTTTAVPLNVIVQDAAGNQAGPIAYSITVNSPGYQVSGQINLNNTCGNVQNTASFTVDLYSGWNTTSGSGRVQTQTTTGNFTFTPIPNGQYTVVPSITGTGLVSMFYPASQNITVNNGDLSATNFSVSLGYTVSGTVTYTTGGAAQTGQTYLSLINNNCGEGRLGTSITNTTLTSTGAFTIRGVPPGSYTLQAWMDPLAQGLQDAIDPSGSASGTITNASVTNAAVTMTNPTFAMPAANPTINGIIPNPQGVLIEFSPSKNSNGIEDANQYVVQWSTTPTLGGGGGGAQFACTESGGTCPNHVFKASGDNGVWILSNALLAGSGYSFSSGQTYYFQARSFNTLAAAANQHPAGWTNYTAGGSSLAGVTIGTPACTGTCTTVSSSVTIPAGITIQSGAPLYLGLLQFSNGTDGGPSAIYVTEIASPVIGANNFTLTVPSGSNYMVMGILDQNNIGGFGVGAVTNVRDNVQANLTISGSTQTVPGITLTTANSMATVTTQYTQSTSSSGTSTNYQLNLDVRESNKLPVAVTLTSGPNVIFPVDMSNSCQGCGKTQFQYSATIPGVTPNVGDTYSFTVTYLDGNQETISGAVTGWNGTSSVVGPSNLATNLAPQGTGSSTTPTFTWTYPANPSSYTYLFSLCCNNNSNIWDIPGNNSKSSGFTSAQIPAASIPWSTTTDPTGASNPPTLNSLVPGTEYYWQIQVQDSNGNTAQTQVYYIP